jgi:DNA-binding GntR family transcriptional regulator
MVDRKKTPSILIEQIRAAILDGLYKPGERLMERDVAAQFHVSRSPVREPLQALESEGTLAATPRRQKRITGFLQGLGEQYGSPPGVQLLQKA